MDLPYLAPLLNWVALHPDAALAVVLLIAFSESLALVGLFMPGAVLMFGIGALIGTGTLSFWPVFFAATFGAVLGDGISFWIGRHFRQRLRVMWPFRTHPRLIARATGFFYNHGGKSILLGRFIGPIRPVIPAVAGMLEMPTWQFATINVVSALLWAPAYLLPGMVFGASLGLAAEVATRLMVLLVILIGVVLFIGWLVRLMFNVLHPRAHLAIRHVLAWTRLHPVIGKVPAALLDPQHPEAKGLTVLALLLILATILFGLLLRAVGASGTLANVDTYVFHTLQSLRTPAMDPVMVALSQFGDIMVLFALFTVLLLWLLRHRRLEAAIHWCAAAGFALVLTQGLQLFTNLGRPSPLYNEISTYAFPSAHATHSTIVYGFLAVLIAREMNGAARWLPYVTTASAVAAIAFSRLYLGAHWLSDVLGGLALGTAWVAFLGIAYRRHPAASLPLRGLITSGLATIALAWSVNAYRSFDYDLERYASEQIVMEFPGSRWVSDRWRDLPAFRLDLRGSDKHPLNLQYAGEPETLANALAKTGWYRPTELDAMTWLRWLGETDPRKLPLLPQVHDGRNEELLLAREASENRLLVLRLWPSPVILTPARTPLWVGSVNFVTLDNPIPGINAPRTYPEFDEPLRLLRRDLEAVHQESGTVERKLETSNWKGQVLLIGPESSAPGAVTGRPDTGLGYSTQLARFQHSLQAFQSFNRVVQLQ